MRNTLVAALMSCADDCRRAVSRSFLQGLSKDELEYIAEYFGACILDSPGRCVTRAELARRVLEFQQARLCPGGDADHKAILLLEYLCRCGMKPA